MTKLAIMSDLHIDLNNFGDFEITTLIQTLQCQGIDWLHLAGDISNHHFSTSVPFLEKMAKHFKTTYSLGNHDMLDLSEKEIQANDFQCYDLGDKVFIAFQGWYDYSFVPDKSEEENRRFKNRFWFDRRLNRPYSDPELTQNICQKLDKILSQQTKPIIIAMHFVPHRDFSLSHKTLMPFNAFLGSQAFHEIFKRYSVTDVVFGHSHRPYSTCTIDTIHYHSRPLGYIREWHLTIDYVNKHPHLNPSGTWNLSKRYHLVKRLPEFHDYLQKQLPNEFLRAMTVFDY